MKPKPLFPALFASLLSLGIGRAQFAEPAASPGTDAVQRLFPLEAARVLAARRAPAVTEVKWAAATGPEGTRWKLTWLDSAGKALREKEINVPTSLLAEGPGFYRQIFREIAGEDWAEQSAPPDNAASAFWQGAELSGANRAEALTAAAKLLGDNPKLDTPSSAARLAGVLTHSALPLVAAGRPLDAVLLARGAAWLCVAEVRLREPIELAWAPILFLSGHEEPASTLWQGRAKSKLKTGAERFWNLALRQPTAADAFRYAARNENSRWSLPALFLFVRQDERLAGPAQEIADTVSEDYPFKTATPAADVWKRVAAEYPSVPGEYPPVAIARQQEIERSLAAKATERQPASAQLADLTDAAIAKLVPEALEAAKEPAPSAPTASAAATSQAAARPSVPADFSTADSAWKYIQSFERLDRQPDSPEDQQRLWKLRLPQWRDAARRFITSFPSDPRRWDAELIVYECAMGLVRLRERDAKAPSADILDTVIAATDATEQTKGDATFKQVERALQEVEINSPHTLPPFHRVVSEFLARYPQHEKAPVVANFQIQLLEAIETPGTDKILSSLATHPNAGVAAQAKTQLEQRTRILELKKKPLELQFTAADGRQIDSAKLRGKIILLDFWASWCGPCMAEAPHVAAAYEKYKARGFEIIGINLDEDKTAMESAAKRVGMTWPQYFDGRGWKNEIATRFGIRSIPSTWLFDGKGKLRNMGLRGVELEAAIDRLLRGE